MPTKKPRAENRPMPEDPHELAQAMFRHGDKKMKEKRAAEKPPPRDQPVTPRQRIASG